MRGKLPVAVLSASLTLLTLACDRLPGRDALARPAAERPARRAHQIVDEQLSGLLLPLGAVPPSLTARDAYLLPNETVARLVSDGDAALQAMAQFGRIQGAAIDYTLRSAPRAREQVLRVSSSVAWYSTTAGAETVLRAPTMELVLHRFGLAAIEISADRIADDSRMFRAHRDVDGPGTAAYIVLFRRDNVIGAVVVVLPSVRDDGGRLAESLARRQAALPLPAGPGQ